MSTSAAPMAIPKSRLPVTIHPIIKVVNEAMIRQVMAFARCLLGSTDMVYKLKIQRQKAKVEDDSVVFPAGADLQSVPCLAKTKGFMNYTYMRSWLLIVTPLYFSLSV